MNEELAFKEDNFLIISKLLVYTLLNVIGIATGLYGYLVKPFEKTRLLVFIGSAIYLISTGIWNLILQYVIISTLYRGKDSSSKGKSVWLRSSIKYPQGIYCIEILKPGNGKVIGKALEIGVGEWIDVDGNLRNDLIYESLKTKLVPKFKFE